MLLLLKFSFQKKYPQCEEFEVLAPNSKLPNRKERVNVDGSRGSGDKSRM